jgi:carbamoyl-phosphate synthase large subunit
LKNTRVLVTGAGSTVGQGIIKALRLSDLPVTIISSDISNVSAGLFRSDEAVILPKVESENSYDKISSIIKKQKIQAVLIGSEYDIDFFSTHKNALESEGGASVIVSPPDVIRIANDKWETTEFLRKFNYPFAEAALPSNSSEACEIATQWGFPIMIKPRTGTSSRNIHIVHDARQLEFYFDQTAGMMLQKLICQPAQQLANEYTCSTFTTNTGDILGPFTARRYLRGGDSWTIEVAPIKEIHPLLLDITERLNCVGSLNIQLFLTDDGPVPFELNARFSGTTSIRAHFGFNEPEFALRNFILKEKISNPTIKQGLATRYVEEVFVDEIETNITSDGIPRGTIHPWF